MIHQLSFSRFGWGSIPARLSFKEHAAWRRTENVQKFSRDFWSWILLIEWRRTRSSWVFPKNKGYPKWMVYNGKPYQNGWFGGTTIFGNTHMCVFFKSFFEHRSHWFRNISGCELSMSMCFAVVVDIYAVWSHFECQQFDPCAWDIYSTPSMGEAIEPLENWRHGTWKCCEMKKRKHSPCHSRFFNPLGSILGVSKNRGKTPKFGLYIYNGNPYVKKWMILWENPPFSEIPHMKITSGVVCTTCC